MNKWIKVTDEAPKIFKKVLIYDGNYIHVGSIEQTGAIIEHKAILVSFWMCGGIFNGRLKHYTFEYDEITHWMTCPELPEFEKC